MAQLSEQELAAVEFIDDQERIYFAEAALGQQFVEFLRSQVGRMLHGRAKQQLDEAKTEMLALDPSTPEGLEKWREKKIDAEVAQAFMTWCAEAINNGDAAAVQLEEYRQ